MRVPNALSLTRAVRDWLADTRHPRVLHLFDRACNLINERREVLSLVTPEIGDGPFNLVVETDILLAESISLESQISNSLFSLTLGDLTIQTANAKLWNPRPDWEKLHSTRDYIFAQLVQLQITDYLKYSGLDTSLAKTARDYSTTSHKSQVSKFSKFSTALANADIPTAKTLASQLAGLGIGLTPSGDDFLMGAFYAAWIIHPPEIASVLAGEVAETASALTTSLSAAWIRSAGRGEAGVLWHNLFHALTIGDSAAVRSAITKLLSVGHTSGADALSGFIGVLTAYKEKELATHENPSR